MKIARLQLAFRNGCTESIEAILTYICRTQTFQNFQFFPTKIGNTTLCIFVRVRHPLLHGAVHPPLQKVAGDDVQRRIDEI